MAAVIKSSADEPKTATLSPRLKGRGMDNPYSEPVHRKMIADWFSLATL